MKIIIKSNLSSAIDHLNSNIKRMPQLIPNKRHQLEGNKSSDPQVSSNNNDIPKQDFN
jgi:hypothetical protein